MGNRGMTNWKLGAFFIISLILCAGLFSNTAIAAQKAEVNWSPQTVAPVADATATEV